MWPSSDCNDYAVKNGAFDKYFGELSFIVIYQKTSLMFLLNQEGKAPQDI